MFVTLLAVTFLIARVFREPIESILQRLIADEISGAWERYMRFAIFVVGISQAGSWNAISTPTANRACPVR